METTTDTIIETTSEVTSIFQQEVNSMNLNEIATIFFIIALIIIMIVFASKSRMGVKK